MQNTLLPKYAQLADRIREDITRGTLKPGSRLPSFTVVQERYGASKQTLERAHALLEQEGLILRRNGVGTFVAERGHKVATGVIAVLQNFPSRHPYYMGILQGIQETAHERQVEVLLLHMKSRISWERIDGLLSCAWEQPDGIIGLFEEDKEFWSKLPPGIPHVGMFHPCASMPYVISDDYSGIREALKHLVKLGHRCIAYLAGSDDPPGGINELRFNAYYDGLREAGIRSRSEWIRPVYDFGRQTRGLREQARFKMGKWLEEDWKELGCTAVFAQNDEVAMGIIDVLTEAGYRVPEDVSVVGFDNLGLVHPACGSLTTIEVPLYDIGATGVRTLLQLTERTLAAGVNRNESGVPRTVLPTIFRMGNSTARVK